jgi:HSP20 family protein
MKRPFGPTEVIPGISTLPNLFEDLIRSFPSSSFSPALDVYEDKDNWYVKLEVPGMTQKDIKIQIEGDVLTIEGEKKHEEEMKDKNIHRVERRWGRFIRGMTLPNTADTGRANAACKDGVLTVTFPKKEEMKRRSITIDVK